MSVGAFDRVRVRRQLQLLEQVVATSDLDAEGVLTIQVGATDPDEPGGAMLLIEGGSVVSGVRVMEGDVEVTGAFLEGMFLVVVGEGAGILLVNEDAGVTTAARRFSCVPSGEDVGVDERQIILRYSTTASRWLVPDWGYYVAADAGDWSPVPTSTAAAIDQLAARAPLAGSGSATWAANAQTVWSYTLAEGEVYGGTMSIVTAHLNGTTLGRSIADVSFVATREVGGASAVTQGTANENGSGSLASGSVTATASGNDVLVRLTFPSLNDSAEFAWSFRPLAPVPV